MAQVYSNKILRLLNEPGVQKVLSSAAEKVLSRAQLIASESVDTGHYLASLRVREDLGPREVRDRVVESTDSAALIIELGSTRRNGTVVPGKHVLSRAVDESAL